MNSYMPNSRKIRGFWVKKQFKTMFITFIIQRKILSGKSYVNNVEKSHKSQTRRAEFSQDFFGTFTPITIYMPFLAPFKF